MVWPRSTHASWHRTTKGWFRPCTSSISRNDALRWASVCRASRTFFITILATHNPAPPAPAPRQCRLATLFQRASFECTRSKGSARRVRSLRGIRVSLSTNQYDFPGASVRVSEIVELGRGHSLPAISDDAWGAERALNRRSAGLPAHNPRPVLLLARRARRWARAEATGGLGTLTLPRGHTSSSDAALVAPTNALACGSTGKISEHGSSRRLSLDVIAGPSTVEVCGSGCNWKLRAAASLENPLTPWDPAHIECTHVPETVERGEARGHQGRRRICRRGEPAC